MLNLGGRVFKKAVAVSAGRGKSGRLVLCSAYGLQISLSFVYGFAKNARANISNKESKPFKMYVIPY